MKSFLRGSLFFTLALSAASTAEAKIKTESIEYKDGNTVLEGYFAYDDAVKGKRPAILVVHEWLGPGPYSKKRAEQLAELGYLAFAVDMYGKDTRPKNHEEAAKVSGMFRSDRKLMRSRITVGLERAKQHPLAEASKVGVVGYCFGGTAAIELARSGADVKAVATFHAGLDSPTPADGKNIKGKIMVFHGADDGFVPAENVAAFQKELRDAKVDWQMVYFGGAVHSFTVAEAGNDPSKGMAYNAAADRRSWETMKGFFSETFK
jgi:dienelactone hydrolase